MAQVIGIVYDRDENWIAGSYYIENLVSAIGILPLEKPTLKVYSAKREYFKELKTKTNYPSLIYVELKDKNTFLDKFINKISFVLFRKPWVVRGIDHDVDLMFPGSTTFFFDKINRKLFWIPDFQEQSFPNFFGEKLVKLRRDYYDQLVRHGSPIVFSSQHAHSDFKRLYPNSSNPTFVLPFAVTLPNLDGINMVALQKKFKINRAYFVCSNQFWVHKNHKVVLETILDLKKNGTEILVIFTGQPYDPRNPDHYAQLVNFANNNGIKDNTLFLGFIDRTEQLVLMKNSIAVIQPSLFEGWSTVVEDAKALGVPIIASDIPVHKEQLKNHRYFFRKESAADLSHIVLEVLAERPSIAVPSYQNNIKEFGANFLSITSKVCER